MKQTPKDQWHDPQEPRNLSGVQFKYTHAGAVGQHPNLHTITARNGDGKYIGYMDWNKRSGKIDNIHVTETMRGLGVATSMYEKAQSLAESSGIKAPAHSSFRTDKGDAWASKVGGKLPRRSRPVED